MIDWKNWVRELPTASLQSGNQVRVKLPGDREQTVEVQVQDDYIQLQSTAAKRAVASRVRQENPDAELFDRNGSAGPIGIALGPYGSLLFVACFPRIGLEKKEFQTVLLDLAQEADVFEFRYTGEDRL